WSLKKFKDDTVVAIPPEKFQLFEVDNKPAVLVVGDQKNEPYWTTFRVGVQGGLSFDKQYTVMGQTNIDDYSLAELEKYKVLVLHAYNYHSKTAAYKLLNDYVTAGGNVFID